MADASERAAHRGRIQMQAIGRASDATFAEQRIQRANQTGIDGLHRPQLYMNRIALDEIHRQNQPAGDRKLHARKRTMTTLLNAPVAGLLEQLFAEGAREDARVLPNAMEQMHRLGGPPNDR